MGEQFIQLPADSTGKKVRSRERTIGANVVQEQYLIPARERVVSGVYMAATGAHVVQAAADAAGVGRWWLFNPVGSAVLVALRRVEFASQLGSALVAVTSPRLTLSLFTATGTASGASITPGKQDSAAPAATATLRTASTGLTITDGADLFAFLPTASATAVGYAAPAVMDWLPEDEGMPVLRAGEGIYLTQSDAGTSSDTRRYVTNIAWEEFTLP